MWAAVLIAVAATAIGTIVDVAVAQGPGMTTQIAFFLGCLIAVGMAQRGTLFGPMVQAPLVLVLVMPLIVFIASGGGGGSGMLLSIANPLISSFPVMAGTIVATVGVGLLRMRMLEPEASEDHQNVAADLDETVEHATPVRERGRKPERGQKPERAERGERDRKSGDKRTSSSGKRPERERSDSARQRESRDRSGAAKSGTSQDGSPKSAAPKNGSAKGGNSKGSGASKGVRGTPPGRDGGPRPAPGRGRPPETRQKGEPPMRPQRPRSGE